MWIKEALITWQKHINKKIKFSKRITSFIGDNDSGKSAIVRAIRWAMLNKPNGSSFLNNKVKRAEVRLTFSDGTVLTRLKTKNKNIYKLNDKEFVAFGNGKVPLPIANFIRMEEASFQRQHNAPFWFDLSASQVSKELNAVVDLSLMDTSLQKASSLARKAKTESQLAEKQLIEARKEYKKTLWTVKAGELAEQIQRQQAELEKAEDSLERLAALSDDLTQAKRHAKKMKTPSLMAEDAIVKEIEEQYVKLERLHDLKERLHEAEKDKCQELHLLKFLKERMDRTPKPKNCPKCGQPVMEKQ